MNTALDLLERVRAEGCEITARGDRIHLRADKPLPDILLDALKAHKPEVLGVLATGASHKPAPELDGWTTADWKEFFAERAGIFQFDGGMGRREAEQAAFRLCVLRWLRVHPVEGDTDSCAWCHGSEDSEGGVDLLGLNPLPVWAHPGCSQLLMATRLNEAADALAAMGVDEMDQG